MVGALVAGDFTFPAVVVVAAIAALREWHRLVNGGRMAREIIPSALAVAAAAILAHLEGMADSALAALALGGALAAASAALRRLPVLWPIPCMDLVRCISV